MRVLLDTHAFLWWIAGDRRLSARARKLIADGRNELLLSAASGWEIAIKVGLGRVDLPAPLGPFLGEPLRLNDALIPGKAMGSPAGAQYQFADRSVETGVLYYYWLESVGVDGAVTRLGPESAAAAQFLLDPPIQ